jgi:hypothetical protein
MPQNRNPLASKDAPIATQHLRHVRLTDAEQCRRLTISMSRCGVSRPVFDFF